MVVYTSPRPLCRRRGQGHVARWCCIGAEVHAIESRYHLLVAHRLRAPRWTRSRRTVDALLARLATRLGLVIRAALELALDALAVRRVSDRWQDRANALDQLRTLSGFGIVEARLHDVIGERVAKEQLETMRIEQLSHELVAHGRLRHTQALFHDVRAEFLRRQLVYMAQELVRDRGCERRFVQIEHVLHNIVAERILHERQ